MDEMIKQSIFLTFDIDWADDEILDYTIKKLIQQSFKGTFFATHTSPLIRKTTKQPNIEIGIHPNFNAILTQDKSDRGESIQQILLRLKRDFQAAISVRSHSLTQNTLLSELFCKNKLLIDSNTYIPFGQIKFIRPWKTKEKMLRVPFVWSDYIDFIRMSNHNLVALLGESDVIKVVAFHPIHIFLNTPSIEYYQQYKASNLPAHKFREKHHHSAYGIDNVFDEFLAAIKKYNFQTRCLKEILEYYVAGRMGL